MKITDFRFVDSVLYDFDACADLKDAICAFRTETGSIPSVTPRFDSNFGH